MLNERGGMIGCRPRGCNLGGRQSMSHCEASSRYLFQVCGVIICTAVRGIPDPLAAFTGSKQVLSSSPEVLLSCELLFGLMTSAHSC